MTNSQLTSRHEGDHFYITPTNKSLGWIQRCRCGSSDSESVSVAGLSTSFELNSSGKLPEASVSLSMSDESVSVE